jgi:hypothetical protein
MTRRQGKNELHWIRIKGKKHWEYLAPDGNNEQMVKVLRQKTEEWRDNIQSGHLNKSDA